MSILKATKDPISEVFDHPTILDPYPTYILSYNADFRVRFRLKTSSGRYIFECLGTVYIDNILEIDSLIQTVG